MGAIASCSRADDNNLTHAVGVIDPKNDPNHNDFEPRPLSIKIDRNLNFAHSKDCQHVRLLLLGAGNI